jgi:hypothetical protein
MKLHHRIALLLVCGALLYPGALLITHIGSVVSHGFVHAISESLKLSESLK